MSSRRSSVLFLLRQEKAPLVFLTGLSVLMQVLVVALTLAASPAVSASIGQLCQPSLDGQSPFAKHDQTQCACGPVCPHAASILACLAPGEINLHHASLHAPEPVFSRSSAPVAVAHYTYIRGPPVLLI